MAPEQVVADDGFVPASSISSPWYENLKRHGSCLRLYDLLEGSRELIHELGPEGITALHKGVQHGCVKLVSFILVDMFDGDGKCTCKRCGAENACVLTREGLLRKTSGYGSTAVNMAVVSGSPKMVLLLTWAIDVSKSCKKRGLTKEDHSSREDEGTGSYGHFTEMRSRFLREKTGSGEEEATESTNEAGIQLEGVPHVKDDAVVENIYNGADGSKEILEVYELIEEKLNKNWGDDQELMTLLMNMCEEHVDFEFVPVAHIFLHFLLSMYGLHGNESDRTFERFREKILKEILEACNERDDEGGNSRSMLVTLFNILDPRGRTILHVAFWSMKSTDAIFEILRAIEETSKRPLAPTRMRECVNAKDGAGRTILHLTCIYDIDQGIFEKEWMRGKLDWDVTVSPLCCEELEALKLWCFPGYVRATTKDDDYRLIHLAVVFNSSCVFQSMLALEGGDRYINAGYAPLTYYDGKRIHLPFQIAAFLGSVKIVDQLLQNHMTSKCIKDIGFQTFDMGFGCFWPAIHCAALSGQVETIQTILKYPIYDPTCRDRYEGTALHFLLKMIDFRKELEKFKILTLLHVLPNDFSYMCVEHNFHKLDVVETLPRMFSDDEESCINMLIQVGIDLWTPSVGWSSKGHHPVVGPNGNNEARKWWFDKFVKEVVIQKTRVASATNATSVIGALIATTSFIGPLQPPLSYTGDGGYIDTTRTPVQVYLVCNNFSFFFSIASILMAVLPAILMPNESMYDELFISQRCLKAAVLMLLIAIICILISFSSASIAVGIPFVE